MERLIFSQSVVIQCVTLLVSTILGGCGIINFDKAPGNSNRFRGIRNGDPVQAGQFTSSVLLLGINNSSGNETYLCSGTVIGRRIVLTAAHCMPESGESLVVDDLGNLRAVISQRVHPEYGSAPILGGLTPDLAVIRVSSTFPSTQVSPIVTSAQLRSGDRLTGVGFGFDGRDARGIGNLGNKLSGLFTFSLYDFLLDKTGTRQILSDGAIITEYPYESDYGFCPGDSGGGLFDGTGNVVGVASAGHFRRIGFDFNGDGTISPAENIPICITGTQGRHISTAPFLDWINSSVQEIDPPVSAPPTNLRAFANSVARSVSLSWTNTDPNQDATEIYRKTNGGNYQLIQTVAQEISCPG